MADLTNADNANGKYCVDLNNWTTYWITQRNEVQGMWYAIEGKTGRFKRPSLYHNFCPLSYYVRGDEFDLILPYEPGKVGTEALSDVPLLTLAYYQKELRLRARRIGVLLGKSDQLGEDQILQKMRDTFDFMTLSARAMANDMKNPAFANALSRVRGQSNEVMAGP